METHRTNPSLGNAGDRLDQTEQAKSQARGHVYRMGIHIEMKFPGDSNAQPRRETIPETQSVQMEKNLMAEVSKWNAGCYIKTCLSPDHYRRKHFNVS